MKTSRLLIPMGVDRSPGGFSCDWCGPTSRIVTRSDDGKLELCVFCLLDRKKKRK